MTAPAIKIEGISKLYRLQQAAPGSQTFRELLTEFVHAPLRRFRQLRSTDKSLEDFWALRDVSFDVQPGEVVGIIGRNGAGKSTLLKILSRIVEPTEGQVTIRGRVASLLEVGTGFHPELSGRENIYLNGSILGMKKREIDARFDEIVAFAEVERFLDTPVKRYSSGMYVRLAFAVAAHLEPEILIVDEVLAVGDAEFQKKCLGKMKDVSSQGHRTVLFVSHNMAAVRGLCSRAVWLRGGRLALDADAETVVASYMRTAAQPSSTETEFLRPRDASIWMTSASLLADRQVAVTASMGSHLELKVSFESRVPIRRPRLGYVLQTMGGERILNSNNRYQSSSQFPQPVSAGSIICDLGSPPLMPGRYALSLWLGDIERDHHIELEALGFDVTEKDLWGNGRIPPAVSPLWWPTSFHFQEADGNKESRNRVTDSARAVVG